MLTTLPQFLKRRIVFFVAKILNNGQIDNSYATNSLLTMPLATSIYGKDWGHIKFTPNGDLLVVGYTNSTNYRDGMIAKYDINGTAISTFATNGKLTLD